ncbi:MAG: hypothetical protein JNM62_05285 [Flavobacteriales bacterium]|nr:hypothetical protein [Flavobacteriales bacterium]
MPQLHLLRSSVLLVLLLPVLGMAQTVISFQGFESPTTCNNWGYTGGDITTETRRTGTNALRIGRQGGSNTVTFNTVNVAGLAGLQLTVYHSVRSGSGPGMDVREGAVMQVAVNGVWTTIGQVGGLSDHAYAWSNTSAGAGSTTCSPATLYQCPNPLVFNVPAGTNTVAFRAFSVNGGSNCTTYNTLMGGNVGSNYDRTDEGLQLDDVSLSTTTTPLPFIWSGAVDTDWHKCGNWRYGVVPGLTSAVTIDQTAVNHCEVYTANAQCASLSLASNTAAAWNLTVRAARQLAVTNGVTVQRSGAGGAIGITLGSTGPVTTGTFSCNDLALTGSAAGNTTAYFRNEAGTNTLLVRGDLTINGGGHLDLSAGATGGILQLQGNYTNNDGEPAFSEQGSLVWFSGTASRSINTSGFEERFGSIRLAKTAGDLLLNDPVSVRAAVVFAYAAPGGRLLSSTAALLSLESTATTTGAADGSHVDGPMQRFGNTAFIYPVGEAGLYRPVQLTDISGVATDAFTVRYRRQSANTAYGPNTDAFLDHVSDCEHWTVVASNGVPNARVIPSWHAIHSCGVTVPADLRVAWWDASAMVPLWRDRGNDGVTTTPWGGWVPSGEVQNQLGAFTLGSTTSENPLPIELLFFDAGAQGAVVQCDWRTATERDNDHFTVERSTDGIHFTTVGTVDAVGDTWQTTRYAFTDVAPLPGVSYYRLRQIDVDGSSTVSNTVAVHRPAEMETRAWSTGDALQVRTPLPVGSTYRVFDPAGRLLVHGAVSGAVFTIPLAATTGVHLLQLSDGARTEQLRVLH